MSESLQESSPYAVRQIGSNYHSEAERLDLARRYNTKDFDGMGRQVRTPTLKSPDQPVFFGLFDRSDSPLDCLGSEPASRLLGFVRLLRPYPVSASRFTRIMERNTSRAARTYLIGQLVLGNEVIMEHEAGVLLAKSAIIEARRHHADYYEAEDLDIDHTPYPKPKRISTTVTPDSIGYHVFVDLGFKSSGEGSRKPNGEFTRLGLELPL